MNVNMNTTHFFLLLVLGLSVISCKSNTGDNGIDLDPIKAKADLFSKVYSDDNLKSQQFLIDGTKDTFIVSTKGVIYRIYANSFVGDKSISLSQINLEIKEALSPVDFVLATLPTTTDGKLLESDGMIYINA